MPNLRDVTGVDLQDEANKRREWLEKKLEGDFSGLSGGIDEVWKGKNIENIVGTVRVPVGVAGPVGVRIADSRWQRANGKNNKEVIEKGEWYLPLSTTEGALVASVARGCKALNESGVVEVRVEDVGMTRAPVFEVEGVSQGKRVEGWIVKNLGSMKSLVKKEDKFLELLGAKCFLVGRSLYVRFSFLTGEAMGMNMVTFATAGLVEVIEKELGIRCVALSGNVCCDKKPAGINWVEGRGKRVWAEGVVKKSVVERVLKTKTDKVVEVFQRKTMMGSVVAGSGGFNAHAANMVAAMFLATGQDMAHVIHGAEAVTSIEKVGEDLFVSVFLPSLPVGVVGGGTGGSAQRSSLAVMGLERIKVGDAKKLAGLIGVGVLAGELSLHGALASGDLARAHRDLGRDK